jgi:hypothetical protein
MATKQIRPEVLDSARRAMRDAQTRAKDAITDWEYAGADRFLSALNMRTLLGEIAGDKDGEDTLDVVSDFLEEYVEVIANSGEEGMKLAHAIGRLGVEARILNKVARA